MIVEVLIYANCLVADTPITRYLSKNDIVTIVEF